MPNIDEIFGSGKTLKAADLDGNEVTLTITDVVVNEFEDNGVKKMKPVIHFEECEKALVSNATNSHVIAEEYGKETDDWVGKTITLFPTRVTFGDKLVDAIRVRILKKSGTPKFLKKDQHPFAPGNNTHLDDEVPF